MQIQPKHKIINRDQLDRVLEQLRSQNKTIAFTNGCFDILHAGHIHSLQQAAQFAQVLIVGLNSDESTKRLKGPTRPFNNEQNRLTVIAALAMVDYVVLFTEDTPENLIKQITPQVLVKGGDYQLSNIVGAEHVIQNGGMVKTIDLVPNLSTTLLSQKIETL
jgi:D-glycero-beta-D-manno-heptose 1-phosphate adenylyltransferase